MAVLGARSNRRKASNLSMRDGLQGHGPERGLLTVKELRDPHERRRAVRAVAEATTVARRSPRPSQGRVPVTERTARPETVSAVGKGGESIQRASRLRPNVTRRHAGDQGDRMLMEVLHQTSRRTNAGSV